MQKKRSLRKVPGRTEQWWLNFESASSPEVWKKNFRVRREDFLQRVEMIRPYVRERSKRASRVFANSEVQKGYTKGKFKIYYEELIPGDEFIPQILLGDSPYPLLPYVMKEYAVCQGNNEVMFNTMLRLARN